MTASTLPPEPKRWTYEVVDGELRVTSSKNGSEVEYGQYAALRSWAEACRAERDALAKDAARYRWLRMHANDGNVWQDVNSAARFDAAIDAAIGLPDSSTGQEGG